MSPVGTKCYRFNRLRAVDKLRQRVTIRNHMKAIDRLKKSGMTRSEIAAAIGVSRHAVRFWEMGLRSPTHDSREKLLDLAAKRGLVLLASDFSKEHKDS